MSDYHINIFYSDEEGAYVADIPDLESCSALGETPERALAELKLAKAAWLEAARESGQANPVAALSSGDLPGGVLIQPVSGWTSERRIALRSGPGFALPE